ncbi:hypothetical protein LXL04_016413 [Taraxacum kok-saghyz]
MTNTVESSVLLDKDDDFVNPGTITMCICCLLRLRMVEHKFFCYYLKSKRHPSVKALSTMEAKIQNLSWSVLRSEDNCGLYLMRNMECYIGEREGIQWRTNVETEDNPKPEVSESNLNKMGSVGEKDMLCTRNLVGRGAYGNVYRGTYDGQDVAVKLLDWGEDDMATTTELANLRASFQQEVVVWQKLDHPNVTSVLVGKPYNRKCDVYSFGVCLRETYCCDLPYPFLSFLNSHQLLFDM